MIVLSKILEIFSSVSNTDSSALLARISCLRSDISVLDSSISTLEDSSPFWEKASLWFSILVAIGVFLELVSIVLTFREEKVLWRTGIVRAPSRPSSAKVSLEVIATLIVGIGIIGETKASAALASINDRVGVKTIELRAKSEELLALVTQQAGNAVDSASAAAADAKQAKSSAESAGKLATRLNTPRHIPDLKSFSTALRKYKGTWYSLDGVYEDHESIEFLSQIEKALRDALWVRVGPERPILGPPLVVVGEARHQTYVAPTLSSGIRVVLCSPESAETIKAYTAANSPQSVRAERALTHLLSTKIDPVPNEAVANDVGKWPSPVIRIWVGSKQ